MKIKEIDRTANVAWSPALVDKVYLAVGTTAQQLDSSFSTNSTLELYHFDVSQPGLDLPVTATLGCENRFHKLVWGAHGIDGDKGEHPMGVIVGGCDGGVMQIYDAAKIMKGQSSLIITKTKHSGAVKALDFNPFRQNLLASGAAESEIYIWDLTNPKTPMTPGTKVQPADDVSHLAWNKQVEHILASTFSTRCVVWDLRKNEPVIKVSDTTSRIRYKVVEWHPEVATQMCLASEDDNNPVIQLWDLRYATAPLKVIQGHQQGILGMTWCPQDPDLLLTCGKESRILCWNPNYPHPGYEMVCDIPTSSQYSFDVSFCPKNPIVIASSSYDGRVSLFGLNGGIQHPVTSSKLADSFPGMNMTLSAPLASQQPAFLQLRDSPKWLKRRCGATFGFGGKLICFSNTKTPSAQPGQPDTISATVSVSQLVTLPNFIDRSKKLEETLQAGSLEYYCAQKAMESGDGNEAKIWEFLQANFSSNPRQEYLSKLGFDVNEISTKLNSTSETKLSNGLVDDFAALGRGAPDGYANGFDPLSAGTEGELQKKESELFLPITDSSIDGQINQALLCGNIEIAVNLCLDEERWADALLLGSRASAETLAKVQNKYFQKCQNEATQLIRAVVTHDLGKLVQRCSLDSWKQVLALITTHADQKEFPTLADMLGQRLQSSDDENHKLGALLCCICSGNLNHLVDVWVSDSAKQKGSTPDDLQDLVEQVMVLKKAGETWGRESNVDGPFAAKLVQYTNLLASQGHLELALNFLGESESTDPEIEGLRDRLYNALRCPRPNKSSLRSRSRQSSESRTSFSLTKRPSYPTTGLVASRGSTSFAPTEFSNLSGPVHPPSYSSNQQTYGNIYVNPGVQTAYGQVTPPTPSYGTPSIPSAVPTSMYTPAPGAPTGAGLPPRPPSTTQGMYNPTEVPLHSSPSGTTTGRIPLGSALPPPPVSSVAAGWNDPPLLAKTTSGSSTKFQRSTPTPIVPPESLYNPTANVPSYQSNNMMTTSGSGYPPPPSSAFGAPAQAWNTPTSTLMHSAPAGSAFPPPPPSGGGGIHHWNNQTTSPPGMGSGVLPPPPSNFNPSVSTNMPYQQPGVPPPSIGGTGSAFAPPPAASANVPSWNSPPQQPLGPPPTNTWPTF